MKISIIGAGNVGSTLAMRVVESGIADVVLLDIVEGLPLGKALDISDAAPIIGHEKNIIGTTNYDDIKGSGVVVITAGFPRKPGMSREDLINKNAPILKDVLKRIKTFCPDSIIIVVTNPLDVMCYHTYKVSGFDKSRIIGMAGTLDTARFRNLIAQELNVPRSRIETFVLGSHGDTMVPLISKTFDDKRPLTQSMKTEKIDTLIERTRKRGAEIVSYLKTGSAYYSPSAGVFEILKSIHKDSKKILCVSAFLEGEYGISDCFLGVPARIGKDGISEIVELDLEKEELRALEKSAEKTRGALSHLRYGKI
jgi:malate dehydrogenase